MLKIRRTLGRLIFNMGIATPGKTVFLIETAPCWPLSELPLWYPIIHCQVTTADLKILYTYIICKSRYGNSFECDKIFMLWTIQDHVTEWTFVLWIRSATGIIWSQNFFWLIDLKYNSHAKASLPRYIYISPLCFIGDPCHNSVYRDHNGQFPTPKWNI